MAFQAIAVRQYKPAPLTAQQDVARVVSFKAHCQSGVPEGTQVVCFHGVPRPWHVVADWIPVLGE